MAANENTSTPPKQLIEDTCQEIANSFRFISELVEKRMKWLAEQEEEKRGALAVKQSAHDKYVAAVQEERVQWMKRCAEREAVLEQREASVKAKEEDLGRMKKKEEAGDAEQKKCLKNEEKVKSRWLYCKVGEMHIGFPRKQLRKYKGSLLEQSFAVNNWASFERDPRVFSQMLDFVTLSKPLNIPDASMLGKLIEEFEHFRIPLPDQLTQNSATARTKEAAKLEWVASANRAEPSKPAVPSKRSEPSKPAPPKPRLIELRELEKPAKQAELLNCEEPPKPAEPARMLEPVQRAALLQLSASREAEGDYENGGHDNDVSYCNDSVHYNDDKYYNEDRYYNDDPFMHAQHCESFIEFQRLWYSGKRRIVELSGLPSARTEPKLAKLKRAELVNYEELAEPSNSAEHMEVLESAKHAEAATPEHIPNAARPARRSEPEERAEPEVEVEEPDHLESWKLDEMMSKLAELGMSCEPYSQELGFEAMTAEMDQLSHPLARNGGAEQEEEWAMV